MEKFTVLMSVYGKDSPIYLIESLESIKKQSKLPDQVIIIQDGIVSEKLANVINDFKKESDFTVDIIKFSENHGLGYVLSKGVLASRNEIIIRADADDISIDNRFELLMAYFESHPAVSILGSYIVEFNKDRDDIVGKRQVPLTSTDISKFAVYRSPFNHPSVAFRRSSILHIGNYRNIRGIEDYDLWIRAVHHNCLMANIPENLVLMRVGDGMYSRRGGKGYLKNYVLVKYQAYKLGVISFTQFLIGTLIMSIHVNTPVFIKKLLYTKILHRG
ncbi:glycosyltransferase [Leuconostoc fallax]|uniref:glycosyltransferase n=1 Tax=Leuconostoc fallax TaxID=1251 RepID=UPI0020902766|nr:glycosyltransferase [Leuconostoc fallax]MCO6183161.1 glycosyltransferase [Leuconostoc fallax]